MKTVKYMFNVTRKILLLFVLLAAVISLSCKNNTNPTAPYAASTFYNFDTSLEYWNSNGLSSETLSINTDSNYIKEGAGSIKCACTLSETSSPAKIGILYKVFVANQDITNRTVTIWVYVPASLASLSPGYFLYLNIERVSLPSRVDTYYGATLNTAGWTQVKIAFSAYSTDTSNVTHDFSDVQMMYFSVENSIQTPADWTGDIYFDELSW